MHDFGHNKNWLLRLKDQIHDVRVVIYNRKTFEIVHRQTIVIEHLALEISQVVAKMINDT